MHQSVMTWLAECGAQFGDMRAWRVLEVGSYNENGSPREIFEHVADDYVGIDMRQGRDVDLVMDATELARIFQQGFYDLVICTEMLEHDQRPWRSVPAMAGVMKTGGHLLMTARGFDDYGGYPHHPCPGDFWRFNANSFNVLFRDAGLDPVEITMDPEVPGVFGHAIKPGLA